MHSTFKRNFPYPLASTVMVMVRLFVAWAACWTIIATSTGYSSKYDRFGMLISISETAGNDGVIRLWTNFPSHFTDIVTRFLSSKFFIHTNKLTYGIYLLNPLIITTVFGLSDGSANADPIPTVIDISVSHILLCRAKCFKMSTWSEIAQFNNIYSTQRVKNTDPTIRISTRSQN